MRIVFGVKHFTLKSYSLKELGLSEEESDGIKIERRQNYFHLYWIPFFPTEKTWVVRKEGKVYDFPQKYEAALAEKKNEHSTPFYTFAFPLLLILGFAIYSIVLISNNYASKKNSQERFNSDLVALNEKITNPGLNDFYEFKGINDYSANTFLAVHKIADDAILLHYPETKPQWLSSMHCGMLATCFSESADSAHLAWISKDELKKFVKKKNSDNSFKGNHLPFTGDSVSYHLVEIHHFKGSEFVDPGEGIMANNVILITLVNKGLSTTISQIKSIEGNVEWTIALPQTVTPNKKFTLTGLYEKMPFYTFEMTCIEKDSTISKYEVKGKGIDRKLKQL